MLGGGGGGGDSALRLVSVKELHILHAMEQKHCVVPQVHASLGEEYLCRASVQGGSVSMDYLVRMDGCLESQNQVRKRRMSRRRTQQPSRSMAHRTLYLQRQQQNDSTWTAHGKQQQQL